jgi:hypothetical protein
MEPRIYPPWEPRPLQELGPGLRQTVEAVREEVPPQAALQRALERAAAVPSTTRVPRPWFRRQAALAAVTLAASLLVALGLWAALTGPTGSTGTGKQREDHTIRTNTVKGLTYQERERLMTGGAGEVPFDITADVEDGRGQRPANTPHPLLISPTGAATGYDLVRRLLLEEKRLPSPASVRVSELINSFPCQHAGLKGEHPVAVTMNLADCPWNRQHHLLCIALQGRQDVRGPIARDLELRIEFNPRRVAAYRLVDEGRWSRPETVDEGRQPGGLDAGHARTALYEIIPAGHTSPAAERGEWVTIRLRYKGPASDTSKQLVQPLAGGVARLANASEDFRFVSAVASFGMLLRHSQGLGTATWSDVRALAHVIGEQEPRGRRAEFLELVDAAAALSASGTER